MFEFMQANPKSKLPRKKEKGADKFYAKYSDGNTGAKNYGGWKLCTMDILNGYIDKLQEWKKMEAANGWPIYTKFIADMVELQKKEQAKESEDEKEADIRRILNFGHTIGHAVEAASRYIA